MKKVLFMFFMLSISFAFSQKQISIEKTQPFPDFKVRIAKELLNSDLKIEIAKDISFADFSVRVIRNKRKADDIITDSIIADYNIEANDSVAFADLNIHYGSSIPFHDLKINIKKSGKADYKLYTDKYSMSNQEIIVALLFLNRELVLE